jgi:hypothetical protein
MSKKMKVYVVIPDNDRDKRVSRITVRTSSVPDEWVPPVIPPP